MLLTGSFAMLSMPSFDFHLPPCTEGFLIHLSPLWQLPLFPSVAQFPCVYEIWEYTFNLPFLDYKDISMVMYFQSRLHDILWSKYN